MVPIDYLLRPRGAPITSNSQNVGDSSGHAGADVPPHRAQHHHVAARHVLAAMVAGTLRTGMKPHTSSGRYIGEARKHGASRRKRQTGGPLTRSSQRRSDLRSALASILPGRRGESRWRCILSVPDTGLAVHEDLPMPMPTSRATTTTTTTRHPPSRRRQEQQRTPSHLDHGIRHGVPHGEPLPRTSVHVKSAARGAVEASVPDDDVLGGIVHRRAVGQPTNTSGREKSTKPEARTNLPLWGCRDRGGRGTNHKPTDSFGAFNFNINFNFNVSRNRKLTCSAR